MKPKSNVVHPSAEEAALVSAGIVRADHRKAPPVHSMFETLGDPGSEGRMPRRGSLIRSCYIVI
jgi:hypothetical protein